MTSDFAEDLATRTDWIERTAAHVLEVLARMASVPAHGEVGASAHAIADAVSRAIPEEPEDDALALALATLDRASVASLNTPGAGYLAYIPGGGLLSAALADLLADVYNRYTGLAAAAPGFCRLEADVLDWLRGEFGYGPSARGLLTTGGSLANFSAIVCARKAAFGDDANFERATAYTSDQAHHSVRKSLALAGIPMRNLRSVACDEHLRMRPEALTAAILHDRQRGLSPFLVIASAGTTNTGAIDPLEAVADVAAHHRVWLHVDGAYGGAFVLCDEGRRRLQGIARAHSITFDPHKGMFLPYGTGALLVADGAALRTAHDVDAEYLQDLAGGEEGYSPHLYGPELSRDFRGLRVWLPLMLHGAGAFRRALAAKLADAQWLAEGIEQAISEGAPIALLERPQLSVVAFRLRLPTQLDAAEADRRNAAWLAEIHARGRVYLSSTMLPTPAGPRYTLRACVLSFRTDRVRVEQALEDIVTTADRCAR